MKLFVMGLLVFASVSLPANAAPSVFVRSEARMAWWNAPMEARVLESRAGPITAEALTAYIANTTSYNVYEVCALEAVTDDTFVGLDRTIQEQIDETKKSVLWRVETTSAEGRKIVAQSAIYEACDDVENRGAALLVWDATTNEVLDWTLTGYRYSKTDQLVPIWTLFLLPSTDDEIFGYSHCSECGAGTKVFYDDRRKRIYSEYNGH